ncbi:MAG: hypothetical protein ACI9OJ_002782, partial [Myxococcota bacterium]
LPAPAAGGHPPALPLMLQFVCRVLVGRVTEAEVEHLTDEQWRTVLTIATAGRVEAVLAHHLPASTPEFIRHALARRAKRIAFAWMWAERELQSVLAQMTPAVGPVVVLKGHAIAPLVYPDAAMRSTNDIDLLVSRRDAGDAAQALVSLGYVETNLFPTRPASQDAYHERVFSRELVAGRVRQPIEIHTGFAQSFRHRIDYDELIARSISCGAGHRLSDVDQLLHFAVHSAREQFLGPLKQLLDVHLWITKRALDWDRVVSRAQRYGVASALWETLRLTNQLFDTPLDPAAAALQPGRLRQQWLGYWHAPNDRGLTRWPATMRTAQAMALLPLLDSTGDRARFLAAYGRLRVRDAWSSR